MKKLLIKYLYIITSVIISSWFSCNKVTKSNRYILDYASPIVTYTPYIPVNGQEQSRLEVSRKDSLSYKLASRLQGKRFMISFTNEYAIIKELTTSQEIVLSRDYNGLSSSSSSNSQLFSNRSLIFGKDTMKYYLVRFVPDTAKVLNMTVEVYRPDTTSYTKIIWGSIHCELVNIKPDDVTKD